MSQNPDNSNKQHNSEPTQEEPHDKERRWSLADGPTFFRSLPEDATEEEKADETRFPWFYNWFADPDAPTTFAVNTFKRSEPESLSEASQPTADDSLAAGSNTKEPEAPG